MIPHIVIEMLTGDIVRISAGKMSTALLQLTMPVGYLFGSIGQELMDVAFGEDLTFFIRQEESYKAIEHEYNEQQASLELRFTDEAPHDDDATVYRRHPDSL